MKCELCGKGYEESGEHTSAIDAMLFEAGNYHPECIKAALKAAFELADVPAKAKP